MEKDDFNEEVKSEVTGLEIIGNESDRNIKSLTPSSEQLASFNL